MSGKPSSTIAFEKRWNPLLSAGREAFIDAICEVPPKPPEAAHVVRSNQGRGHREDGAVSADGDNL